MRSNVADLARDIDLFTGFDEVWCFAEPPRTSKPNDSWIVALPARDACEATAGANSSLCGPWLVNALKDLAAALNDQGNPDAVPDLERVRRAGSHRTPSR